MLAFVSLSTIVAWSVYYPSSSPPAVVVGTMDAIDQSSSSEGDSSETFIHVNRAPNAPSSSDWLMWTGGGVAGFSHSEAIGIVERRHKELLREWQATYLMVASGEDPSVLVWQSEVVKGSNTTANHILREMVVRFAEAYVSALNPAASVDVVLPPGSRREHHDDCIYHLLPQQQFMCHMWWSTARRQSTTNEDIDPVLGIDSLMRSSLCSVWMACGYWRRGTFDVKVTPSRLRDTYKRSVLPLLKQHRMAVALLRRNFVHSGRSAARTATKSSLLDDVDENTAEYAWLAERTAAQLADIVKRNMIITRAVKRPTPTDVRSVFQGGEVGFDQVNVSAVIRDNGDPLQHPVPILSSSEVLAVLFHRALRSAARSVFPRLVCPDGSARVWEPFHVLVFSGDSLTREVFFRLIHHLRYGVRRPVVPLSTGSGNLTTDHDWMPFMDIPIQEDYVYAVYKTHDDLTMFDSVAHNNTAAKTINQYFVELAADRRRHLCGHGVAADAALLYLVLLWDPFTQRPRRDVLAPCRSPLGMEQPVPSSRLRLLFYTKHKKLNVTPLHPAVPLQLLGANLAVHVHGAVHWERAMFPTLGEHWVASAGDCDAACPHGVDGARYCADASVVSGDTYFYVMTSASGDSLGHARVSTDRWPLLIAPVEPMNQSSLRALADLRINDQRVARTVALFQWLANASAQVKGPNASSALAAAHRQRRFISRLRILDKGKLPYAPHNVFARVDGTHLACQGFSRLFGKHLSNAHHGEYVKYLLLGPRGYRAMRPEDTMLRRPSQLLNTMHKVLDTALEELQRVTGLGSVDAATGVEDAGRRDPYALLPLRRGTQGFIRPQFRATDKCGDFGNLVLLHALLSDMAHADGLQSRPRGPHHAR